MRQYMDVFEPKVESMLADTDRLSSRDEHDDFQIAQDFTFAGVSVADEVVSSSWTSIRIAILVDAALLLAVLWPQRRSVEPRPPVST